MVCFQSTIRQIRAPRSRPESECRVHLFENMAVSYQRSEVMTFVKPSKPLQQQPALRSDARLLTAPRHSEVKRKTCLIRARHFSGRATSGNVRQQYVTPVSMTLWAWRNRLAVFLERVLSSTNIHLMRAPATFVASQIRLRRRFADGSFAFARHRKVNAFGLARCAAMTFVHADLPVAAGRRDRRMRRMNREAGHARSLSAHSEARPIPGLHSHLLASVPAAARRDRLAAPHSSQASRVRL